MGMFSRAMRNQKERLLNSVNNPVASTADISVQTLDDKVKLDYDLMHNLHEIAERNGTTVQKIIETRMWAYVNAYDKHKILGLNDPMPYGQYRGLLVEDMIRTDPRYVRYLASVSEIFVINDEAIALLESLG